MPLVNALVSEPALRIEVLPDRETVFLALLGELDLATAPAVEDEIRELRARGFDRVVIDLRSLAFMDSTGVSLLLREAQAAPDGAFAIVPGDGEPCRLLEVTGVLEALRVVRERDAPRRVAA